jgi:hypothetical protein
VLLHLLLLFVLVRVALFPFGLPSSEMSPQLFLVVELRFVDLEDIHPRLVVVVVLVLLDGGNPELFEGLMNFLELFVLLVFILVFLLLLLFLILFLRVHLFPLLLQRLLSFVLALIRP